MYLYLSNRRSDFDEIWCIGKLTYSIFDCESLWVGRGACWATLVAKDATHLFLDPFGSKNNWRIAQFRKI